MIIENICVKNKFVYIKNAYMDLEKNGIYLIEGTNGSGKTSLLEKIVFGKYNASFKCNKEKKLFDSDRFNLFTYMPQSIVSYKILVKEYILRGNDTILIEDVMQMLKAFELEEEILDKTFNVLSGGEKVKIAIISAILKDTPYIFFDEPTNNLDDKTVEIFSNIIWRLSFGKVIVIVSHDERLNFLYYTKYQILGNGLICETYQSNDNTYFYDEKLRVLAKKPTMFKIINGVTLNYAHYITIFFLVCTLVFLACFTHYEFVKDFNTEKLPGKNYIFVSWNNFYDEINERYTETVGISIDEEDYLTQIQLSDVSRIANVEGVEKIYLKDSMYINELQYKLLAEDNNEELLYFSCPEILYEELWEYTSIDYGLAYVEGKLPEDGKNEVAISEELLINYYGFTEHDLKKPIDKYIEVKVGNITKQYRIVGLLKYDMIMISYEEENNYGVYCYDKNTFEEYVDKQNRYAIEQDSWINQIDELIIVTNENKEKRVLDQIIEEYPANHYYSYSFVKYWSLDYNKNRIVQVMIPNLIFSSIMSVIIFFVNRNSLKYNYLMIRDYENYYVNRRMVKRIYRIFSFCQYVIVFFVVFVLNTLISQFSYISNFYLIINLVVILMPLVCSHYIKGVENIR